MYTTVYLAYTYDLDMQWKILKRWCIAAGDKFNENKMEVKTIGIHITKEGEVTRILGGWIGNAINDKSTWSKALVKIADYFKLWGRGNPMLFGQSDSKNVWRRSLPIPDNHTGNAQASRKHTPEDN